MSSHEIVLPQTKPETEWVRGRALQKTGGTYLHSSAQARFAAALRAWAASGRGRVAPSWRFRVAPPGKVIRPLVPDVGYLSFEAVPLGAPHEAVQVPEKAPTVAVEVLCEDDLEADIDDKITTYLDAGSAAVIIVDPDSNSIQVHDRDGSRSFQIGQTLTHPALPGFALDVRRYFDDIKQ